MPTEHREGLAAQSHCWATLTGLFDAIFSIKTFSSRSETFLHRGSSTCGLAPASPTKLALTYVGRLPATSNLDATGGCPGILTPPSPRYAHRLPQGTQRWPPANRRTPSCA